MKNEKGITLATLIIYVILMTFIVSAIASITSSFYSNMNEFDKNSESAVDFSKFNMYFIRDIKRENVSIAKVGEDYIILSYGEDINGTESEIEKTMNVEYSVQNNTLYRNKVKICDDVNNINIVTNENNNTIKVNLTIGDYNKSTIYALENHYNIDSDEPII